MTAGEGLSGLHEAGGRFVVSLFGLLRNLRVHKEDNQAVVRVLDDLLATARGFCETTQETFHLQLVSDDLFVCGRMLKMTPSLFERGQDLARSLVLAGVGELAIGPDVTPDDLLAFCRDLNATLRDDSARLEEHGYGAIRHAPLRDEPSTTSEMRPDRLALWLAATLLDLVEQLHEAARDGRRLSLLPVKRVLQRTVEAVQQTPDIYAVLPAVRDHSRPPAWSRTTLAELLHGVGFGVAVGLARDELLALGLSTVLSGLHRDGDGRQTADGLLRLRELGDLGPAIVQAVLDADGGGDGGQGVVGQVIALARAYERRQRPASGEPVAPGDVLASLTSDPPSGVLPVLAAAFARHKGPQPLGSPVELTDGALALVLGWEADGEAGPIVGVLYDDGTLGTLRPAGGIAAAPAPAALGLNLATVRRPDAD